MALLRITEFSGIAVVPGAEAQVAQGIVAHQTITIGAQADSAPLSNATRIVRLKAEANCCVVWGQPEQTATTNHILIAAGETEYFGVAPGDEISCITV
jgi:hypothetical protein